GGFAEGGQFGALFQGATEGRSQVYFVRERVEVARQGEGNILANGAGDVDVQEVEQTGLAEAEIVAGLDEARAFVAQFNLGAEQVELGDIAGIEAAAGVVQFAGQGFDGGLVDGD